ncbi:Hsp33 family molecular chaperone HslO [Blautia sp. OF03-15BH]|uniref:Hsp33 family molecular chaperone HslO n=1 Tax=Blautia sp. OF03-15BH TaxID=2292287 RepID=UPI000E4B7C53|nr:Hsp33 family molecular chaperone HslO [Blautia sp. OF03-15BH]RGY01932.1 Hsp33 family molecular chaperone HslO [Blautia sp. OF03-15BH]
MGDYIVRATAADNQIRAFAATTKELVEKARAAHDTSPVATAALGRLLTGGVMMGVMMKGEKDLLTLQVKGDGPIGGITVTADSQGHVKGYVENPDVLLPANTLGKLDVGGAVGNGMLRVIKDMGLKEPYVGQVALETGELGDDLTYYFATSEQVPSSVGLGVLMEKDNTVKQAGGFIIQLMPFTDEKVIEALEKKISEVQSVTSMLNLGMTPEDILNELLGEFHPEISEKIPAEFHCDCSKKRVEKVLISLGKKELTSIINDGKPVELKCHFCNSGYTFTTEELKEILKKSR